MTIRGSLKQPIYAARRRSVCASREAHPAESIANASALALVHELQVHQIELEMQNEELQRAQAAAEEASEKYHDLFDFAPVGYFLWDHEGRILEVNLAGAALLGLDRSMVVQKRFGQFVAMEDRPVFADFCKRVLTTDTKQTCEAKLLKDGQPVYALVEGIAARDRQGQSGLCRAAIIDITRQKQRGGVGCHSPDRIEAAGGAVARTRFRIDPDRAAQTPPAGAGASRESPATPRRCKDEVV